MKKGLLLLLGIILIVILSYFCFMGKAQGINEDLVTKSTALYADKQMGWVDVAVKGKELEMTRTLVLSGVAPSAQKREEAELIAQNINGVWDVDNQLILQEVATVSPPVASAIAVPYKVAVTKDKLNKVTLLGDVPNIEVHNELIAKAKTLFGNENVIDKLTELKGKPTAWKESITLGLERLADVDYGQFNIEDKDFNFEGYVSKAENKTAVIANLKENLNEHYAGTYNVTAPKVEVATVAKPIVPSPYTISAIKNQSNQITLSGYVDNADMHKELVSHATTLFGKENVIDELKEVEGSPEAWKESAILGLDKLKVLDYGQFNIEDKDFNFEGYVGKAENKIAVIANLQENLNEHYAGTYNVTAPKVEVATVAKPIVPSPYTISAIKNQSNQITLSGYVDNSNMHKELVSHATTLFGKENVIDELKEVEGSPEAWKESAILGLDKLKVLDYGQFNISDMDYNFTGYIGSQDAKALMLKNLNSNLNSAYSGTYDITAPMIKSFSCQENFELLLAKEKIHFEYDRATIKRSSYGVLDKLVDIAKQCPNSQIEIEGHTDSDGSKKYNQKLSFKRANAVKKYLIGKGIQKSKLTAIGYGEMRPIATNKTSKGKEQNRRIEFNVKGME